MVKRHSKGEYLNEYLAIKTLKGTLYTKKRVNRMMQGSCVACVALVELGNHETMYL